MSARASRINLIRKHYIIPRRRDATMIKTKKELSTGAPAIVVLAAGKGTRMRSDMPKVLHKVAGEAMLAHVVRAAAALEPQRIVVVAGPGMEDVAAAARQAGATDVVIQPERLGTGDALKAALPVLQGCTGRVLVFCGDAPLVTAETLGMLLARTAGSAVAVLGMEPENPAGYGRLKCDANGMPQAIVEEKDASEEERAIRLCNSGVMAIEAVHLPTLLGALNNKNAKGEYYLTDVVAIARESGLRCGVAVAAAAEELLGVNSKAELAAAEAAMQARLRARAMEAGVSMMDPASVFLSADTRFGRDVTIQPQVFFGPGVTVGERTEIRAFSHIEGATIGADCIVGPFARLRPGTVMQGDNKIGNFVEIKNTMLEEGAQASHLSYLGDATIGARTNIGAGTITCNYDGKNKFRTSIGEDVFIGSNAALIAPVTIGNGALVAAGSTITQDVPPGDMAIARQRQINKTRRKKAG